LGFGSPIASPLIFSGLFAQFPVAHLRATLLLSQ
jgi:hypothetical protein